MNSAFYIKTTYAYGGFWKRVVAALIDGLILLIPSAFCDIFSQGIFGGMTLLIVIEWLYVSLLESSRYQATLGKQIFSLIVVNGDYQRLTWANATLRYFCQYISMITLGFGYLMVAFTPRKRGLHDYIANTYVVYKQE